MGACAGDLPAGVSLPCLAPLNALNYLLGNRSAEYSKENTTGGPAKISYGDPWTEFYASNFSTAKALTSTKATLSNNAGVLKLRGGKWRPSKEGYFIPEKG